MKKAICLFLIILGWTYELSAMDLFSVWPEGRKLFEECLELSDSTMKEEWVGVHQEMRQYSSAYQLIPASQTPSNYTKMITVTFNSKRNQVQQNLSLTAKMFVEGAKQDDLARCGPGAKQFQYIMHYISDNDVIYEKKIPAFTYQGKSYPAMVDMQRVISTPNGLHRLMYTTQEASFTPEARQECFQLLQNARVLAR